MTKWLPTNEIQIVLNVFKNYWGLLISQSGIQPFNRIKPPLGIVTSFKATPFAMTQRDHIVGDCTGIVGARIGQCNPMIHHYLKFSGCGTPTDRASAIEMSKSALLIINSKLSRQITRSCSATMSYSPNMGGMFSTPLSGISAFFFTMLDAITQSTYTHLVRVIHFLWSALKTFSILFGILASPLACILPFPFPPRLNVRFALSLLFRTQVGFVDFSVIRHCALPYLMMRVLVLPTIGSAAHAAWLGDATMTAIAFCKKQWGRLFPLPTLRALFHIRERIVDHRPSYNTMSQILACCLEVRPNKSKHKESGSLQTTPNALVVGSHPLFYHKSAAKKGAM